VSAADAEPPAGLPTLDAHALPLEFPVTDPSPGPESGQKLVEGEDLSKRMAYGLAIVDTLEVVQGRAASTSRRVTSCRCSKSLANLGRTEIGSTNRPSTPKGGA